ncbi:protein THEM6-like [Athalia rosae]|uniref:protein THEM6-like n=1 Tax=Athalia rosae TaxID=37344 RepID=UPI0020342FCA|nr:protein THEM6-like [Athalia rosae]XP_048512281.1 protein THEM6-like [Athalia rosae]
MGGFFYPAIAVVAMMYALFDVNYFIRVFFTLSWRKLIPVKRRKISDAINIYGFCTTNDVDLFITHMNNARFIRELDFARFDYYHRTGIYEVVASRGGSSLQVATTVRHRRVMPVFTFYRIETKLIYWDQKAAYLEHKFITLSDNFVRATVFSKQQMVGLRMSTDDVINEIDPGMQKPEAPEDLTHWIKYNESSSEKLRKVD